MLLNLQITDSSRDRPVLDAVSDFNDRPRRNAGRKSKRTRKTRYVTSANLFIMFCMLINEPGREREGKYNYFADSPFHDRDCLYKSGTYADYSCTSLDNSLTKQQAEKEAKKKEVS